MASVLRHWQAGSTRHHDNKYTCGSPVSALPLVAGQVGSILGLRDIGPPIKLHQVAVLSAPLRLVPLLSAETFLTLHTNDRPSCRKYICGRTTSAESHNGQTIKMLHQKLNGLSTRQAGDRQRHTERTGLPVQSAC